jgi:polyphosphate kinase 2 (PPK2 family)
MLKAQHRVQDNGAKLVVLFEGRDAAGKGSTIKRFMEHLNPRGARVVALSAPTELERGQWYFQRYVSRLPSAGEIVLFDRSWYNRAGVERVTGFCTSEEYQEFLGAVVEFERMLVARQWKLSPMDLASLHRWDEYTAAKEAMFHRTHSDHAPWTIVRANDQDADVVGAPDPLIVGSSAVMARDVGERTPV